MNISIALWLQASGASALGQGAAGKNDAVSGIFRRSDRFSGRRRGQRSQSEQLAAQGAVGKADLQEVIWRLERGCYAPNRTVYSGDKVVSAFKKSSHVDFARLQVQGDATEVNPI
jgi:hypothetical protein